MCLLFKNIGSDSWTISRSRPNHEKYISHQNNAQNDPAGLVQQEHIQAKLNEPSAAAANMLYSFPMDCELTSHEFNPSIQLDFDSNRISYDDLLFDIAMDVPVFQSLSPSAKLVYKQEHHCLEMMTQYQIASWN